MLYATFIRPSIRFTTKWRYNTGIPDRPKQQKSKNKDLSKENEEIEALTSVEKNEGEIEETFTFTEEIDNCKFERDKAMKKTFNSQRRINQAKKKPRWKRHLQTNKNKTPEARDANV